jgi:Ribosomal Proteins L2, C-terminal domain
VKLPSRARKVIPSTCRTMVGQVAGGGRTEKTLLTAGRTYWKYKAKRNCWAKVRGVAMNPVEHTHGGINHQRIGQASTVSATRRRVRRCPPPSPFFRSLRASCAACLAIARAELGTADRMHSTAAWHE